MKKMIGSIRDSFIPSATKIIDNASDMVRDTVSKAITHGDGNLITKEGNVYKNSNSSKGFAFEHTQEATFNANATLLGKPYEAVRITPGKFEQLNEKFRLDFNPERLGEPDIIIINTETGEIIKTIQAKVGNEEYILKSINNPKYKNTTDEFIINSDHTELASNYDNVSTVIELDGVTSLPVSNDMCITIAENPELSAILIQQFANGSEVLSGAAMGSAIGGVLSSIQASIKILAKVYRGEVVDKIVVENSLKEVFEAIKSSAFRGAFVKVLQIIIDTSKEDNSSLPVVLVSIGIDTYPIILKYLNDEISFNEMLQNVSAISLSRAIIVTVSMTYPPVGMGLIGFSILNTLWKEFELSQLLKSYIPNNPYLENVKNQYKYIIVKSEQTVSYTKNKTLELKQNTTEIITNKVENTRKSTQSIFENLKKSVDDVKLKTIESANHFSKFSDKEYMETNIK